MSARTRSLTFTRNKGFGQRNGVQIGGGTIVSGVASCDDITGPGDCAPLTISRWNADGGLINRPFTSGFSPWFIDYVADVLATNGNFPHIALSDVPSDVTAATQAAARTSPSRPYVDVPVNIIELGDVSHLLHDAGEELVHRLLVPRGRRKGRRGIINNDSWAGLAVPSGYRTLGTGNIVYNFGIAPLVGDLVKLVNFTDQVNRRVSDMEKLFNSPTGYRRTVRIGSYSGSQTKVLTCQSNQATITSGFTGRTAVDLKVHCRWKPTSVPTELRAPDAMRAAARRAVLGMTVDLSTAWEAMPWSWLLDWCGNVGTFLKANRNIIPATLQGVHILKHTRTTWTCPFYQSGSLTMSPISFSRESKTRNPSFVAPVAHFPFLDGRQVGILASLAVTRR